MRKTSTVILELRESWGWAGVYHKKISLGDNLFPDKDLVLCI